MSCSRKVFVIVSDGPRIACALPDPPHETFVRAKGSCPACGAADLAVSGRDCHASADDRAYEADAIALCCGKRIGVLRYETGTLFGVREDEAVLLHGRCRVY